MRNLTNNSLFNSLYCLCSLRCIFYCIVLHCIVHYFHHPRNRPKAFSNNSILSLSTIKLFKTEFQWKAPNETSKAASAMPTKEGVKLRMRPRSEKCISYRVGYPTLLTVASPVTEVDGKASVTIDPPPPLPHHEPANCLTPRIGWQVWWMQDANQSPGLVIGSNASCLA